MSSTVGASNGGDVPGGGNERQLWYHSDHLQSTQFVTGVSGAVEEHYESFPYGEPWIEQSSVSAAQRTAYRFTGKEYDSETGLFYFGARYFDPRTSQWESGDPALGMQPDPSNRWAYSYGMNSPLRIHDPDGRHGRFIDPESLALAQELAVGGVAVGGTAATIVTRNPAVIVLTGVIIVGILALPYIALQRPERQPSISNTNIAQPQPQAITDQQRRRERQALAAAAAEAQRLRESSGESSASTAGGGGVDVPSPDATAPPMDVPNYDVPNADVPSASVRRPTMPTTRPPWEPSDVHRPHVPGGRARRGKTPEPTDSQEVYNRTLEWEGSYYGRGANGEIYRYQGGIGAPRHFNGMTGVGGTPTQEFPIEVRREMERLGI